MLTGVLGWTCQTIADDILSTVGRLVDIASLLIYFLPEVFSCQEHCKRYFWEKGPIY